MLPLSSPYGDVVNLKNPLPEHPNPYFERPSFLSLNGRWDFQIDQKPGNPLSLNRYITVPFAVETSLSGVHESVGPADFLHYRRKVSIPNPYLKKRLCLHFEAVDQVADVFWNGRLLGHHEGGYLPFSFLIEKPKKENVLEVRVQDDTDSEIFPRGKQSNHPGSIWYTPTSGIYGSVYLEPVPVREMIENLIITPVFDRSCFNVSFSVEGSLKTAEVSLYFEGRRLLQKKVNALKGRSDFRVDISAVDPIAHSAHPWSPEQPSLYRLVVKYGEDVVASSCGLRKFSLYKSGKSVYPALNNQPILLLGLLDQGYFPESGLTPPSEAAMKDDILLAKRCGFNCLRKHIKIEPMRWYYLCDKLGMIVSQDFVSGGSPYHKIFIKTRPFLHYRIKDTSHRLLGRSNPASRERFRRDIAPTIALFRNVASLMIFTAFNEGWGQFDSQHITRIMQVLDPTRLIDSTSGWYDTKSGNFYSRHIYFRAVHLPAPKNRILALSEFGGYSLPTPDHMWSKRVFGYKVFKDGKIFNRALSLLWRRDVIRNVRKKGLAVVIYTQLSDVEEEINGLVSFDRAVVKVDELMMQRLNEEAELAFKKRLGL